MVPSTEMNDKTRQTFIDVSTEMNGGAVGRGVFHARIQVFARKGQRNIMGSMIRLLMRYFFHVTHG